VRSRGAPVSYSTTASPMPIAVSTQLQKPEKHSIPIGFGPAQFNAFYPQCSGPNFRPPRQDFSPEHCR
jgi:hypothetical protein